ncbi:amino acid adenylation domain-containing protein [Williamsia sp.]|uniref:non-ribosomal peptide synthetase n=1 Tax=Williamsia sp. TaxID=1872085 RepID=UPI002F947FDE
MHTARTGQLTEQEVRETVAEKLGIPTDSIDNQVNLISMGLDSVTMMKLSGQWRRRGTNVKFATLAQEPTLAAWFGLLGCLTDSAEPEPATTEPDHNGSGVDHVVTDEPFALASMQHAYWVGRQDGQTLGGVAAHLYVEFDGSGVDPQRLEHACSALAQRHRMLRTRFLDDGLQQVLPKPPADVFSVRDLRTTDDQELEGELDQIRHLKTHQRMDVSAGQGLDVTLTLLPDNTTRLHIDVDMLVADAMSYRTLMSDLATLYRDPDTDLGTLDYTYQHYLDDHRLATTSAEQDRRWWADRVPELPDPPQLPLVPTAERTGPADSVRYAHWLSPEHVDRLFTRAREYSVTPAMVLAAMFAEVVGRWSSSSHFLLNLPLFDREPYHRDVDKLVGDFTNSLMLDVDLRTDRSFFDAVSKLQRTAHNSALHSGYSGLDILRDLGRHRGEPVIAPVVYTSGLNLGELFADVVESEFGQPKWIISQGPQVVLDAQVAELHGGVLLNWDARRDAIVPAVADAMFDHYRSILERVLDPGCDWKSTRFADLPPTQAQVRRKVNSTAVDLPARTLHHAFFSHAATTPDRPALLWDNNNELRYSKLAQQSLAVAGALSAQGIGPGDTVAVRVAKGHRQVIAVLGVLAAGATYLPIGADQPAARQQLIFDQGDVRLVLIDRPDAELSGLVDELGISEAIAYESPLPSPVVTVPTDIAYVLFTSGSTGRPKGVEVTHSAAANTIDGIIHHFGFDDTDRTLALSALEFDLSVFDIFAPLSLGGAVVSVAADHVNEAVAWAQTVQRSGVTVLNCAPGLLDMLLTVGDHDQLNGLRTVVVGGDWVGVDLPGRLRELAPTARFAGLGGATETAIHSTVCEVSGPVPAEWKAVPYGTPLPNVQCRIVDDRGLDCPDRVTGELWIGGASVALGYRGDPERTSDRFVEHEGVHWYRTGDLARYQDDGSIEFLGRGDHQVKIRGYRVELGEVEAALRTVDGVAHAVAAVIGSGPSNRLAAVVAAQSLVPDPEFFRRQAAQRLPDYMVPEQVVVLDAMPLTPNGKIDRKKVIALIDLGAGGDDFAEPTTDLEAALVHIVEAVLEKDRVGIDDDFFASGGDSILATTVIARTRGLLSVGNANITDVFAARTIRALAARLIDKQTTSGRLEQIAAIYLDIAGLASPELPRAASVS